MLTYLQGIFSKRQCLISPAPIAQINITMNAMKVSPDSPIACYNYGGTLTDLQVQSIVLAANAPTTNTHGYEHYLLNDETSATVTAKGNLHL